MGNVMFLVQRSTMTATATEIETEVQTIKLKTI